MSAYPDWNLSSLKNEDWDFSKALEFELPLCLQYEYGRNAPHFINRVYEFRKKHPRISPLEFGRDKKIKNLEFSLDLAGAEPAICFIPEFPFTPWLKIDFNRRKKLAELSNTPKALLQVSFEELGWAENRIPNWIEEWENQNQQNVATVRKPRNPKGPKSEIICLNIDWSLGQAENERRFAEWYRLASKKRNVPRQKQIRSETRMRMLLKSLGAFRLLTAFQRKSGGPYNFAVSHSETILGTPLLSCHAQSWSRARVKAIQQLKTLFPA